ncbi:MAG TPA: diacylglycerol kinase family protein [Burkholderiales bacterium]|nr:diacylglycerol kinase family protein [Burkholderiales bacterium]
MRVTLIHNPGAGAKSGGDKKRLLKLLEDAGHDVRYQSADDEDWEDALADEVDLIAVAGGDGTVGRVARGIVGRGIPVAPLPSGTANNISRSLGLIDQPFEDLVRAWPDGRRVKLDIAVAEGPWGTRSLVEGLGMGLFARLLAGPRPRRLPRKPEEKVSHTLERLRQRAQRAKQIALKATLDGKDISGDYLMLEAVSIPYVGSNLFLAPESKPGDGQLDVVQVTTDERDRLVHYLTTWQENRERLAVLPSHRGKRLTLEWTGYELHLDDKLWPGDGDTAKPPARIELRIDAAVEFLAPSAPPS